MLIYVPLSGFLFGLGGGTGSKYDWKGWRRFIFPLVTFGFLLLNAVVLWKALVASVLLSAVLHLGYGQTKTWMYKFLVGCSYAIPSLVIGLTWWVLITPSVFITLFYLSNLKATEKDFTWKVVEMFIGFCIAATFIGALMRPW